jgi:hypothetical protein
MEHYGKLWKTLWQNPKSSEHYGKLGEMMWNAFFFMCLFPRPEATFSSDVLRLWVQIVEIWPWILSTLSTRWDSGNLFGLTGLFAFFLFGYGFRYVYLGSLATASLLHILCYQ